MESLALVVAVTFLAVTLSGPLAWLASVNGYIYVGAMIGLVAITLGMWWSLVAILPVALVGWMSVALGIWSVLQACRGKPPY